MASRRANSIAREGYFENLTQYVGAGFNPTVGVKAICPKDYCNGGVFLYTKVEQEAIRRVNFWGKSKEENFMEMVSYLFELGNDLALSHKYNVLESPGFKGCGLIFDRKRCA